MKLVRRFIGPCGAAVIVPLLIAPAIASAGTVITRYAGSGAEGAPVIGQAAESPLGYPESVAVDSRGNLYLADTNNDLIEKVSPDGLLTVVAGTGTPGEPAEHAFPPYSGVPATSSALNEVTGVAVDASGNVYIADYGNHVVEKVTPGGTLTVIAGTGSEGSAGSEAFPPHTGEPATNTKLEAPEAVAADAAGNVYIADAHSQLVEKVTPGGTLTVIAGNGTIGPPAAHAFPPYTGVEATTSAFDYPEGVAVAADGDVYISDLRNAVVDRVTPAGILTVVAGTGSAGAPAAEAFPPYAGVEATESDLKRPEGLSFDSSGNLYIADVQNGVIEKLTPGGTLSVVAGTGTLAAPSYGDSPLESDLFYAAGVTVDSSGVLYVPDEGDNAVARIGPETPAPPTLTSVTPGSASATIDFLAPVSYGTTAITAYEVSTDGGLTWHVTSTSAGPGESLEATLTGLTAGATYHVLLRAVNGSGAGPSSDSASVTPPLPTSAPSNGSTTGAKGASAICVSRRTVTLHWKIAHGVEPGRIVVTVNGKAVRTLPPSARRVTLSFAGRTGRAPVTVRVQTRTGSGLTLRTLRALHLCTPARAPRALPNLHLLP